MLKAHSSSNSTKRVVVCNTDNRYNVVNHMHSDGVTDDSCIRSTGCFATVLTGNYITVVKVSRCITGIVIYTCINVVLFSFVNAVGSIIGNNCKECYRIVHTDIIFYFQ